MNNQDQLDLFLDGMMYFSLRRIITDVKMSSTTSYYDLRFKNCNISSIAQIS